MRELSVFVDESGDLGGESRYYLLALVFHDQRDDLSRTIGLYERDLVNRGLKDIPLHLNPLLRANDSYSEMPVRLRATYLASFSTFAQHSSFVYHVFSYRKDQFTDSSELGSRMRRDLVDFLFDNIEWLQNFDVVKIYYDDGQSLVTRALHGGFECVLAREAVVYRDARPADYRMLQVADYVCGVELASLKYDRGEESATDRLFFGTRRDFVRTFLRKLRRHML